MCACTEVVIHELQRTEMCTRSTSSVMPSVDSTSDEAYLCFCLQS